MKHHHPRRYTCPHCGGSTHRHGDRRRRCSVCRATFRVYPRKRGRPKTKPPSSSTALRFLAGRDSVRSLAVRLGKSVGTAHRRLRQRMVAFVHETPRSPIPAATPFVLIADGLWILMNGVRWTIALVLLRERNGDRASLAAVIPRRGYENTALWCDAFTRIPEEVKTRVIGAVSDDNGGLQRAITLTFVRSSCYPIPVQRCIFHLLAEFLRKLTKKATRTNPVTKRVWHLSRVLLNEPRAHQRHAMEAMIVNLVKRADCPPRTKLATRWFVKRIPEATVCYRAAHARLPTTSSCAEAICKKLRKMLGRIRPRTESDLLLACELFIRLTPSVRCKSHRID